MALWLVRAGRHGEQEDFALDNDVVTIGWSNLPSLSGIKDRETLLSVIEKNYPDEKSKTISNWLSQIWAFIGRIKEGDLVVLPLKQRSAIAIGRVKGPYQYRGDTNQNVGHVRPVEWIQKDIPRGRFDQDLLYSFGAFMTVCQIQRNNADERVKALLEGKKVPLSSVNVTLSEDIEATDENLDIEQVTRDQIRTFISHKFRGHELTRLVGEVLKAQGYKVRVSPPGADGGVDIVAGQGPMGFDHPRMVVQVKSGDDPLSSSVVNELQGAMKNFSADHGLIVSWGGYKQSIIRDVSRLFFDVRLWDADNLIHAIQSYYDKLSDEFQAEFPLKRIWTLVYED